MKSKLSIQIKAAFLLVVFGLNTVVGLACAVGIDMKFNSGHHHDEPTEADSHTDTKNRGHHDEIGKSHDEGYGEIHSHEATNQYNYEETIYAFDIHKDSFSAKEGCCSDEVQKFQNLDKELHQNAKIIIKAPLILLISSALPVTNNWSFLNNAPVKYKPRFFYPPPPDIRLLIQSFQI